ncbi:MAG: PD40 domain-containing protein [Acidobacteriaceae bacterium]|nr:PD40 domain-containing protein [Acidobacteriaceae bacterium]
MRLTSDPRPDLSPAWSPDGRSIAFLRFSPDDTGEVLLIPPRPGGGERRLAQVRWPYTDYRNLRLLAWSPDGKWLALPDADSSDAPQKTLGPGVRVGISLLSVETGEKRKLTVPPATYDDFEPAFSPDGTRLAFVRFASRAAGDVYLLDVLRATFTCLKCPSRCRAEANRSD